MATRYILSNKHTHSHVSRAFFSIHRRAMPCIHFKVETSRAYKPLRTVALFIERYEGRQFGLIRSRWRKSGCGSELVFSTMFASSEGSSQERCWGATGFGNKMFSHSLTESLTHGRTTSKDLSPVHRHAPQNRKYYALY